MTLDMREAKIQAMAMAPAALCSEGGWYDMVVEGLFAEAAKKSSTDITNEPIGRTTRRQHAGFPVSTLKLASAFCSLSAAVTRCQTFSTGPIARAWVPL
jgi:hypothetical protein